MLAMLAMVFGALMLSGLASLVVAARSSTDQTRKELVREAQALAYTVSTQTTNRTDPARALTTLLTALKPTLRIDGSTVLGVRAGGALYAIPLRSGLSLPSGVTQSDLDPTALYNLQTVSASHGGVVFAAVPYRTQLQVAGGLRDVVLVAVLTAHPPNAWSSAGPWFALSALAILLIAWLVAWQLGRRFVQPIEAAREVTGRVAAGDLEARVPEPRHAGEELVGLADSINAMTEGLARAKGAERLFLQSVSHDLRTPLTSIRGFAEAIEDGATADVLGAARVIASEARRLERLVADLLALATVEARRFTLHVQPVDLTAAATSAAAGFLPSAADLSLIIVSPTAEPIGVLADPDRLAQVAANLIENALRFAKRRVRVQTVSQAGQAILYVEDDGPGIAPEDLARVFDRLFESRPREDRPVGTGLGLTIVAELVSAMGGEVRAESPVDGGLGTRMVVTLPAAPAGDAVRTSGLVMDV